MRFRFTFQHLVWLLCLLLVLFRLRANVDHMLTWDVFGYYLYLPAQFIYGDIGLVDQEWLYGLIDQYHATNTLYQADRVENGNWVIRYTMGNAFMYAPFFFMAHALAELLGYPDDGFSLPYQFCVTYGALLYAMVGLIFLGRILRRYFDELTSGLALLVIYFGTNYFHLTIYDGTLLTHNFLFMFYAILVYYTIRWYDAPSNKYAILIGLSAGMITLIRPSEGVCILIPILWWQGESGNFLTNKLRFFKTHARHVLLMVLFGFLVLVPQFLYWKSLTGHYLFFSYTNPAEGLDFWAPHTIDFLFSFRKGWFIYTPIMVFALLGMILLYRRNRAIFYGVVGFFLLDLYVISSWTAWWYAGGSFSSRALVPAYVVLAIPIGYFIEYVRSKTGLHRWVFGSIGLLLIALNLFQSWQFVNNIISKEHMTRAYYFAVFGQTQVDEETRKLLLINRARTKLGEEEASSDYISSVLYHNQFDEAPDTVIQGSGAFVLDGEHPYSPGVDIIYKDLTDQYHAWVKIKTRFFIPEEYNQPPPVLVATFHYKGQTYHYRTCDIKPEDLKYNDWNEINFDYLTPELRTKNDNMKVYLWHRGTDPVPVDYLKMTLYEPKD